MERERIDTYIASQKIKESVNTLTSSKVSNVDAFNENDIHLSLINLDKIDVNNIEDKIN